MTLQYSTAIRNAQLAQVAAAIGVGATLELRTGAPPVNCAAPDSGSVLATVSLPAAPFSAPVDGVLASQGAWQDLSADAPGTAAHFRIKTSAGVCCLQGTVTLPGGGGDLAVTPVAVLAGALVTITTITITARNA